MARTPNADIPLLEAGSLQIDALFNEFAGIVDAWQNCVVLEVGRNAPSGTEVNGNRVIVGTGTGVFTGHDNELAILLGGTWQFYAPPAAGVPIIKDLATGDDYECTGGVWAAKPGGGAVADGDYGDIAVSGSGAAWLLDWTSPTFDDDATLAANSSTRVPTQQAVKSAIAAAVAGLAWKQAVRVASVTNGTLATTYEAGDTINGVVLATGDRILLKDQTTASENGIYVVQASGAPVRATDADSGAELVNASVYVSEGSVDADTQWTCTTNAPITVGSTSLAFAKLTAGGGLTNFTEGVNTASPNATAPYVYLIPNNGATRVDIALVPKSANGAFSLAVADGAATGGNKRGTAAVDLQLVRANASYVASGASSALIGGQDNVTGGASAVNAGGNTNSVSASRAFNGGGQSNTVSGVVAANIGGANNTASANGAVTLGGSNNTASGLASVAHGTLANTRSIYNARSVGCAANNQILEVPLYVATTNATPTILRSDSAAAVATNQYALPSNRTGMVRVRVSARQSAGSGTVGDSAGWDFNVLIKNIGGTTSIVGTPTTTAAFADTGAAAWAVAVAANSTLDTLEITVTGEASKTIQWTAYVIGPES